MTQRTRTNNAPTSFDIQFPNIIIKPSPKQGNIISILKQSLSHYTGVQAVLIAQYCTERCLKRWYTKA